MNLNPTRLTTAAVVLAVVIAALTVGTFASSHLADDEQSQSVTYLRVAHLSPDAPAVDVYLDNESLLRNASFGAVTGYFQLVPGTYNVTVTEAGDRSAVVHEGNLTIEPRSAVTIAASGELATEATRTFELRTFADDAFAPENNTSVLRIVHLSPDAGAVTITADNGSTVLAENLTNGNMTDYVLVAPGNYSVEIRSTNGNGNGTPLASANVSLVEGQAHTVWAIGYVVPMTGQEPFQLSTTEDPMTTLEVPSVATPPPATETPANATETPTGTATETPNGTVTETPTGTATETPNGTVTETPTGTATETPTGTATETPTGTETETPPGSPTETATPTP